MSAPMHVPLFFLKQKFAMTINRYELQAASPDGQVGQTLGFAEQKRMAFKEEVTFYTDQTRTQKVFSFKARKVMDLNAGYDVFDEAHQQIGFFRKDFGASLLRSTFHVEGPGYAGTGQERSQAVGLLRRFADIPFLPIHFDYVDPRGPAAAQHRAAGHGPRPLHRPRPRPARRLPDRRGARRGDGRPDGQVAVALYPEARAAVEAAAADVPVWTEGYDVAAAREANRAAALAEPPEDVAEVLDLDADGVPVRLYRPDGAAPGVVVHLHGGGFVFHDLDVHDRVCRRFANRLGMAVLSVDYRLAPEHRFPAAPDDVDTVLAWLDRDGATLGARRADVRPRRQRGRQPRAGRRAPPPGPVRARRCCTTRSSTRPPASSPTSSAPPRLRPARGRLVLAAVRRRRRRPRPTPTWRRCSPTGSARCRRPWSPPPSTTRCATRASTSPR